MVQHILSIDFDYIMFPCIKLYNDLCNGSENSNVVWNNIEWSRGVDEKFLQYDSKSYHKIVKLVQLAMEQDKNVDFYPIKEHQEIVDILRKTEGYDDTVYKLVNIDFHHDVLYNPADKTGIKRFNKYSCANWAGYLLMKDKLQEYIWIKAPNSDLYNHQLDGKDDIKFYTESGRVLDNLEAFLSDHPFDKIFLCLSPQWVPNQYKHLYDLIIELFGTPKKEE